MLKSCGNTNVPLKPTGKDHVRKSLAACGIPAKKTTALTDRCLHQKIANATQAKPAVISEAMAKDRIGKTNEYSKLIDNNNKKSPSLNLRSGNLPSNRQDKENCIDLEFDEEELDEFLKESYNLTDAQLATIADSANIFDGIHDLTFNHCQHRNDGTVTTGTSKPVSSGGIFELCVPDGSNDATSRQANDDNTDLPNPNTISGDERLELFRRLLDEFNWERQANQVDFHEMMIKTALPCIFKDEWNTDYDRILRIFDLYQHVAETFIVCPRRFGKTVSVAMFCADYMYCIPEASIAIFSTAQRTSGKMMLAIYQFMRELPYFRDAIFTVKNSETITIILHGVERTMWCYPGTVAVRAFNLLIFALVLFFCLLFEDALLQFDGLINVEIEFNIIHQVCSKGINIIIIF